VLSFCHLHEYLVCPIMIMIMIMMIIIIIIIIMYLVIYFQQLY